VKRLQLWLLAFLMATLPFRGALAGVLPCPVAFPVSPPAQTQTDTDQQLVHAEPCVQAGACALTPLLSASPSLPLVSTSSTVTYPALRAIAADFFSDGQERPPRGI